MTMTTTLATAKNNLSQLTQHFGLREGTKLAQPVLTLDFYFRNGRIEETIYGRGVANVRSCVAHFHLFED